MRPNQCICAESEVTVATQQSHVSTTLFGTDLLIYVVINQTREFTEFNVVPILVARSIPGLLKHLD